MAREIFKNLPDKTTPLNASKLNGIFNGEEPMGSIVVEDVVSKNRFNSELQKGVYLYADGTYSGGASALNNYLCTKTFTKVKAGETIHLSLNYASAQVGFIFYNDAGTFVSSVSNSTATVPEGATKCHINIQKNSTATSIELSDIEWVQIEPGNKTTDYVPHKKFGYNDTESMGKIVVDDISCKNLFDKSFHTDKLTYTGTGEISSMANSFIQEVYIPVSSSTQYTFSSALDITGIQENKLIVCEYDSSYEFIERKFVLNSNSLTITTSSNTKYVRLCSVIEALNYLQFEKGSVATEYTPHKKYGYNSQESMGKIVVDDITSKNLISQLVYDGIGNAGTTYQNIDNKKIVVKANNNIWGWVQFTINNIPTNQELTYSSDVTSDGNAIINAIIYDVNDNIIGRFDNTTETKAKAVVSFTSPTETIKIRFSANNSGTYLTNTAIFDNLMIEKGDKATPYTPYKNFDNNEYVLYSGSTLENITLNDNVSNYEYIEIFYYKGYEFNSTRVYDANGKRANLIISQLLSSTGIQFSTRSVLLSDNTLTNVANVSGGINIFEGDSIDVFNTIEIVINRIVGYKKKSTTSTQSASTMSLRPDTTEEGELDG